MIKSIFCGVRCMALNSGNIGLCGKSFNKVLGKSFRSWTISFSGSSSTSLFGTKLELEPNSNSNSNTKSGDEEEEDNQVKVKLKLPKKTKMPPRPKVNEDEIEEKFIKGGSGKGGQKINKTNSKVQLTHILTGLVVTSQATRSREQNRKIAREILALKLQDIQDPINSRLNILKEKKKLQNEKKKAKSKKKYQKLQQEKLDTENKDSNEEQEFIKKLILKKDIELN
ncbi:hypothetical protein PACTADRAFT_81231 [Pachysolen tannophilus NRRL Y-2460]|uniref:Prokaryotic-type class I peptide chain release factors domain-containing protein n=1 Tax=Pachysolen tannophilus NRRL Y-2460 TaxID=669874 RepID=A0A1E4TSF2_PACTA|nr:hypothetical protein PACTADRAFT_81231 [Pachysolen tannophilus NRRL Y-2460]